MTSNVTLITPTCDRPFGIAAMERYVAAQTVQPHQWIVSDGGSVPAKLTMGQQHLRNPSPPGSRNLASNVMAALSHVTGDVVVFVEDDDYYAPDHIERCLFHLRTAPATGARKLRYYNIEHRCWIVMANRGAALCQTAFRSDLLGRMETSARTCFEQGSYGVDGHFWSGLNGVTHTDNTVVGLKGLPGTKGLGIGHRPHRSYRRRWRSDPGFGKLREWIGDAADYYTDAYNA